jgi:hypothetical protein
VVAQGVETGNWIGFLSASGFAQGFRRRYSYGGQDAGQVRLRAAFAVVTAPNFAKATMGKLARQVGAAGGAGVVGIRLHTFFLCRKVNV